MSLQLRSSLLKLSAWSNHASVYSTVTKCELNQNEKLWSSVELYGEGEIQQPLHHTMFTPHVVPPSNSRLGTALQQGKKMARQMRRKLNKDNKRISAPYSASLAFQPPTSLFLWQDESTKLKKLETDPSLVAYKNPNHAIQLLTDLNMVIQPLSLNDNDIIVHKSCNFDNNLQPTVFNVKKTEQGTKPDSVNLKENCGMNRYGSDRLSQDFLQQDLAKSVFQMHHRLKDTSDLSNTHLISPLRHDLGNATFNYSDTSQKESYCVWSSEGTMDKTPEEDRGNRPSDAQLAEIHEKLADALPKFFVKSIDYSMYRQDIIFENNFHERPTTVVGISPYVFEMLKLRWWAHWRYSNVKLVILKITHHREDSTVKVRWRITGLPQMETVKIWKFLPWIYRKSLNQDSEWHDAFSVYWVGSDGLISKHRIDRIMPEEEPETVKKNRLVAKLASLT